MQDNTSLDTVSGLGLRVNILQVINAKWWNAEAAYAYSLTKGLIKRGHKVCILGLPGKPVIKKAAADNIRFYETDGLNSGNPLKILEAVKTLFRVIETENIEVINCHKSDGFPLVVLASRLSHQRPVLVRTRGDQRAVKKNLLNKILYGEFAGGIIASGEVVKKGLISRLGLNDERVEVIYASVDTERFKPTATYRDIRREFGIPAESPLVAILGRVSEVKGHRYFIEAASLVSEDFPTTRFLIIVKEDDPNLPNLKQQVRNAGLDEKVIFTGFRDDLTDVMASCDIGVVASIGSETNCRVALEWMAMGKPVVGTTVGVIPEVIKDGETGYLVPPKNPSAITDAVKKLIRDKNMASSFGSAGRKSAESLYNESLFVEKTLRVYSKEVGN